MPLVLLAGAAGLVAAYLLRTLFDAGFRVRALDDLSEGDLDYLSGVAEAVDFRSTRITDAPAVDRAMEGVAPVVHLAARSGVPPSIEDRVSDFAINLGNTCACSTLGWSTEVKLRERRATTSAWLDQWQPMAATRARR